MFCVFIAAVGPLPGVLLNVLVTPALVYLTAFAMFSWHAIEYPILKLRKRFSFIADRRTQAAEQGGLQPAIFVTDTSAAIDGACLCSSTRL